MHAVGAAAQLHAPTTLSLDSPTTHSLARPTHVLARPARQLLEGNKYLLSALGSGLWPVMVLLSEVVQTFILGDFW